jgi:hypothetical protein
VPDLRGGPAGGSSFRRVVTGGSLPQEERASWGLPPLALRGPWTVQSSLHEVVSNREGTGGPGAAAAQSDGEQEFCVGQGSNSAAPAVQAVVGSPAIAPSSVGDCEMGSRGAGVAACAAAVGPLMETGQAAPGVLWQDALESLPTINADPEGAVAKESLVPSAVGGGARVDQELAVGPAQNVEESGGFAWCCCLWDQGGGHEWRSWALGRGG